MKASHRLPVVVALAAAGALGVPAAAGAAALVAVGPAPAPAAFAGHAAKVGVTIRNDSRFRGRLTVRLALDNGTVAWLGGADKHPAVGTSLRLRGPDRLRVRPRGVRRIVLRLVATPVPKRTLTGTVVVAARGSHAISPATIRVAFRPAAPVTHPSRWAKAKSAPATVVVSVHRWLPSPAGESLLMTDAQDVTIHGIAAGPAIAKGATLVTVPVSGDTGGRGDVTATLPDGIGMNATDTTLRLDAHRLTEHGEYDATIPLDSAIDASPAVTVKVIAQDLFVWPLVAIFLGSLLAYRLLRDQEQRRPKEVLKLALTRLKTLHETDAEDEDSPVPYPLDPFPDGGEWDACKGATKAAHVLWCRIGTASTKEELDDIAAQVALLDVRVRAWPIARAKVKDLLAACAKLPEGAEAARMRASCTALSTRDPAPAGPEEANQYFAEIEAQIAAVRNWLWAKAMLDEAEADHAELGDSDIDPDLLRRHDPRRWEPDLVAAAGPGDLDRCGVVAGLCRDVHVLRSLIARQRERKRERTLSATTHARRRVLSGDEPVVEEAEDGVEETEAAAAPQVAPGPPQIAPAGKVTPSTSVSDRLVDELRSGDRRTFLLGFVIAGLGYFVLIYNPTYGSLLEYLTAFASGAASTFATNFNLLPWFRSFRPPAAAAAG